MSRAYFRVADLITPERIILTLSAIDKHQLVEKLARLVVANSMLDKDLVRRAVLNREDRTSFGVGRGIAIPHAIVPGTAVSRAAFARLKRPVDFGAADGRPADLVFLLLVPDSDPGLLLPTLSCVARRLRDREVAARLRAEADPEVAYIILTSDSWRGQNPHANRKRAA